MSNNRLKNESCTNYSLFPSLYQFELWCMRMIKHPRISIILPLLILFLFSYPFLSTLLNPHDTFTNSLSGNFLSKLEVIGLQDMAASENTVNLNLLQILVKPIREVNVLNKKTLLEFLAFQARLLKGIEKIVKVISPFKIWNHSLTFLKNDQAPLHTINSNIQKLPKYSLLGPWKINGVLSSATGFVISLLVDKESFPTLNSSLIHNINQLNEISNITSFHILPSKTNNNHQNINESSMYSIIFFNKWDNLLFISSVIMLLTYFWFCIKKLRNSVKSIVGISVAILAQLLLVIISSSAITNFWFKNSNDHLPFHTLYLPTLFVLINNQMRLLRDISGSSLNPNIVTKQSKTKEYKSVVEAYDNTQDKDFITSIAKSHYFSTKWLVLLSLLHIFFVPFSRKSTCFLSTALWIGHFLHCGFFTAVLSLDLRRFDSDANVMLSSKSEEYHGEDPIIRIKNSTLKQWFSFNKFTSVGYSFIVSLIFTCWYNRRFAKVRTSSSIFSKIFNSGIYSIFPSKQPNTSIIFDYRSVGNLVHDQGFIARSNGYIQVILKTFEPIYVLKNNEEILSGEALNQGQFDKLFDISSFISSYKIDFSYAFEFILLMLLVISCTLLSLQRIMVKLDNLNELEAPSLYVLKKSKNKVVDADENNAHTKAEPQNISCNQMESFHIKELYENGHTLDIVKVTKSKSPFVVSVGLDYKIFVWSPLVKPIPSPTSIPLHRKFWPLSKVIINNDGYYIAFFSNHGNITVWSRRHMKFLWELQMKENSSLNNAVPLEAFFRKITKHAFQRKRPQNNGLNQVIKTNRTGVNALDFITMTSVGVLDASYEQVRGKTDEEDEEELVFLTAAGLIYSIDIKGKIQVSNATPSKHSLRSCEKLSSPRVNDRLVICDEIGDLYISTVVNNKWRPRKLTVNNRNVITPPERFCRINSNDINIGTTGQFSESLETDYTIQLVSFVGMLIRVIGTNAELIDAQTGTLIRTFSIGQFKPDTLQTFHDTPTHCKFCGSASVASFSIAYTDALTSRVVLHTFQLESNTKTSICLRVERDAREIRCLGMESAVETIHYLYNVEDWCITDTNMLMGIRRVPENITKKIGTTSLSVKTSDEPTSLQNRKHKIYSQSDTSPDSLRIHNIWEGWTMTANGSVSLHKIPVGFNGLIVNKLGPLVRFGPKAMVVAFANIMNLFYVGHEDMLFTNENDNAIQEESSLKFVNKRRDRLSSKKVPINYGNVE